MRGRHTPASADTVTFRTNMNRNNVGRVVQARRHEVGLSQRDLAKAIGVKSSHVAYIEAGQRYPSISVVGRIADRLGFDPWELFLAFNPEVRRFFEHRRRARAAKPKKGAWEQFASNRILLRRYRVTPRELSMLKQVSSLQHFTRPDYFLLLLGVIRAAGERM
jgi:transcriptional regulator with XRE-family HTH domain